MEKYVLDGNTFIVSGNMKSVSINVPSILESYDGKPIDTIVFEEGIETIWTICDTLDECLKNIKTVVLPTSLVSIGANAFKGYTALETLELPEKLKTIGYNAFKGCTLLRSIVFPKSLVSIGDEGFSECASLEKVELPESLTTLGKYAFNRCSSLKSVQLPQSLTVIEDGVFNECRSLSHVDIPEGVVSIHDFAFSSTGIRTLVLPSTLQTIGGCAFGIVPELQVKIPCTAPVFTSKAFFEMDDLPRYYAFDPNQMSAVDSQRSSAGIEMSNIQCPRCHSNNISQRSVHKLFSIVKAIICLFFPAILLSLIGKNSMPFFPAILLGFIGKNRIKCTCHDCGETWFKKPRKISKETLGEWFMYL